MENIEQLLDKEIESQFEAIKDLELGSDEYKAGTEAIAKLLDRKAELEKIKVDANDKAQTRSMEKWKLTNEYAQKQEQINEEKKDRKWRTGIGIAGIAVPALLTIWGTLKSLKFEETGTITTPIGRGFINKLLPKK